MRKLLSLILVITLVSCQKEIETSEEFATRTNRVTRLTNDDKLAITVDFNYNPVTSFVQINRYDWVDGQQVLIDQTSPIIRHSSTVWSRNFTYTGFPYRGTVQVIVKDSIGTRPIYEKWMNLTNQNGDVISLDTAFAQSGWAGGNKILDVVPKHYQ